MTRQEFTIKIAKLIVQMEAEGDIPVMDWGLRNTLVQRDLYEQGKSKCDGIVKKSAHQLGIALDIYLSDKSGKIIYDVDAKGNEEFKKRVLYWHSVWDKQFEGDRRIDWDAPHFEG